MATRGTATKGLAASQPRKRRRASGDLMDPACAPAPPHASARGGSVPSPHGESRKSGLPERPEARAHLLDQELRLLPRGEVPALRQLVEVDQVRIRLLRPAPRRLVELVGEHACDDGKLHAL